MRRLLAVAAGALAACAALAGNATLTWSAPLVDTSGALLSGPTALSMFNVYERCGTDAYGAPITVPPQMTTAYRMNLPDGVTCFWQLSAVNAQGESARTAEVSKTFPPVQQYAPGAVINFDIVFTPTPLPPGGSPTFIAGQQGIAWVPTDEIQQSAGNGAIWYAAGYTVTRAGNATQACWYNAGFSNATASKLAVYGVSGALLGVSANGPATGGLECAAITLSRALVAGENVRLVLLANGYMKTRRNATSGGWVLAQQAMTFAAPAAMLAESGNAGREFIAYLSGQ